MGYFTTQVATPTIPASRRRVVRVRVADSLGAINPYLAAINQKFGTSIGVTSSPPPTSTFSPVSAAPAPSSPIPDTSLTIRTLSPTSSTPPFTAPAPPPSSPDSSTQTQPPPSSGGGSGVDTAAQAAAAAAPFVGAVAGPAAGAVAAAAPAFSQAFNAPDTVPVSFDTSMPEVYNADGTPATPTAAAATKAAQPKSLADTFAALPPAAKIGGAVVLYLLFGRR